ncbi:lipopolysaccharide export system permease protein [Reichenbachiella faecimaris]|uniref:Lipopolysaccharide export system permease protein n=1 Tax=Reichenbachiella faecimaris TaxID=692418 RepID=A0A1W2G7D2_REIFA|nr:LptF/LptG family permease [Reichenbachiella faecimaris]SMD32533.1 lipopolysaccharide export system permease protein [Reichenbachiella faecimaris]
MKKLDKLILKSFIGPFVITFLVAVFILLLVYMMKYFDDFIGKNIGFATLGELMGYFSINQMPMALPLAVLISSLMTYGKLGEHFELTAIKGSGISLIRIILPAFVFCVMLAIGAFVLNDRVVPTANLRAFSLLYDIKQTKPALDLREGQFYSGIPKYSIKIDKKYPDGISIKNIVIYDHTEGNGNKRVIIADSCRMYSFMGDRYLKMDLFNGNHYIEEEKKKSGRKKKDEVPQFVRTKFANMDLVFSLASFDLNDTDESLFADNRYMKGITELTESIDSMGHSMVDSKVKVYGSVASSYKYHLAGYLEPPSDLLNRKEYLDSLKETRKQIKSDTTRKMNDDGSAQLGREDKVVENIKADSGRSYASRAKEEHVVSFLENKNRSTETREQQKRKKEKKEKYDSLFISEDSLILVVKQQMDSLYMRPEQRDQVLSRAVGNARNIKSTLNSSVLRMKGLSVSYDSHVVEKYKKYAQAFSCIVMFLIGAPLGAIIKKGGLGVPIIISIFFYIIFFVLTSMGDKWAKSGVVDGLYAAWMANAVLFPIGVFFLKQARKDAKIFDADFYNVWIDKVKMWWVARMAKKQTT